MSVVLVVVGPPVVMLMAYKRRMAARPSELRGGRSFSGGSTGEARVAALAPLGLIPVRGILSVTPALCANLLSDFLPPATRLQGGRHVSRAPAAFAIQLVPLIKQFGDVVSSGRAGVVRGSGH